MRITPNNKNPEEKRCSTTDTQPSGSLEINDFDGPTSIKKVILRKIPQISIGRAGLNNISKNTNCCREQADSKDEAEIFTDEELMDINKCTNRCSPKTFSMDITEKGKKMFNSKFVEHEGGRMKNKKRGADRELDDSSSEKHEIHHASVTLDQRNVYQHAEREKLNLTVRTDGKTLKSSEAYRLYVKKEDTLYRVIDAGLREGYRFIDTAQVYGNEATIGKILESLLPKHGLKREDIWITSKLAPSNAGIKSARKSIEKSLSDLKVQYLDLMLIHWPGSSLKSEDPKNKQLRVESWNVMSKIMDEGKLKAIGVSNFEICHIEELKKASNILPSVNQVEYHPHFHQDDLVAYCNENNIHFQAYSSLGSPTYRDVLIKEPLIEELARKYDVELPVLLLGFAYCQGISVLPRTTNPDHVSGNFKVTSLKISQEDIQRLLSITVDHKTCWDPRVVV